MTRVEIELPTETFMLSLGRNAEYGQLVIDMAQLPPSSLSYIFEYGLRQVINDSIATKTDKYGDDLSADAIRNKAIAKRNALYDGNIRARTSGSAIDEYEVEAFKEMKRHLIAQLTKGNQMGDIPKKTENRFMYAVNRMLAKAGKPESTERDYLMDRLDNTPAGRVIREKTRQLVDERRAMEDEVIDLIGGDTDQEDA